LEVARKGFAAAVDVLPVAGGPGSWTYTSTSLRAEAGLAEGRLKRSRTFTRKITFRAVVEEPGTPWMSKAPGWKLPDVG